MDLKPFPLTNDSIFVVLEVQGGVYNSLQLAKVIELCDEYETFARVTEDLAIGIAIPEDQLEIVRWPLALY